MDAAARRTELVYPVPKTDPRWVLEDDESMPESALHDAILLLLVEILLGWVERQGRAVHIGRNLALRWDPAHPRVGVDPDVIVLDPMPPGGEARLRSLCTWKPGHEPPRVAVEVVSESTAAKDYGEGPDKYAASGTHELWVFDPERFGPQIHGGPFVLQVWRRDDHGRFTRVYAGDGPARSEELKAWLVVTDGGCRLRLADDAEGASPWPTRDERALAEVARLRAELARLQGS